MVNLVDEIPDLSGLESEPRIHVHVYGKTAAPGRKLGHITIVADAAETLEADLQRVLEVIGD
jgi:5-(carboxyamino)imidazole ribonucleotide synthase